MRAIKRMIMGIAIILLGFWLQVLALSSGFLGWIVAVIPLAGFLVVLYSFVDPRKE